MPRACVYGPNTEAPVNLKQVTVLLWFLIKSYWLNVKCWRYFLSASPKRHCLKIVPLLLPFLNPPVFLLMRCQFWKWSAFLVPTQRTHSSIVAVWTMRDICNTFLINLKFHCDSELNKLQSWSELCLNFVLLLKTLKAYLNNVNNAAWSILIFLKPNCNGGSHLEWLRV